MVDSELEQMNNWEVEEDFVKCLARFVVAAMR